MGWAVGPADFPAVARDYKGYRSVTNDSHSAEQRDTLHFDEHANYREVVTSAPIH